MRKMPTIDISTDTDQKMKVCPSSHSNDRISLQGWLTSLFLDLFILVQKFFLNTHCFFKGGWGTDFNCTIFLIFYLVWDIINCLIYEKEIAVKTFFAIYESEIVLCNWKFKKKTYWEDKVKKKITGMDQITKMLQRTVSWMKNVFVTMQ